MKDDTKHTDQFTVQNLSSFFVFFFLNNDIQQGTRKQKEKMSFDTS